MPNQKCGVKEDVSGVGVGLLKAQGVEQGPVLMDSSRCRAPAAADTELEETHSLNQAHRPSSVHSRSAPRGSSPRRREGGPHGEHGATQEPHSTPAQNT